MHLSSQLYLDGADIESRGPLDLDARVVCTYNKGINYARVARPTHKGEAPLLASYARRWAATS